MQRLVETLKKESKAPFDGVIALAKRNKKHRFFLASKKNFIGPLQVPAIMVDSGCSTMLLPLAEGQLHNLASLFPATDYHWRITVSNGVGANSLCLYLTKDVGMVNVVLCGDLGLPKPPRPCEVRYFRFHLCTEDLEELLKITTPLDPSQKSRITNFLAKNPNPTKRRKYALLGQGLLGNYSNIQHGVAFVVVDPASFSPANLWSVLADYEHFLTQLPGGTLPDGFDDLEDDDHDGDDDDMMYSLDDEVDD